MKLISLNVGTPQPFSYNGKQGFTSIFKYPVYNERTVSFNNVEGDAQGDLSVHGGTQKAVYSYDISYYGHWKNLIQFPEERYGLFGENLTTAGLVDAGIFIGNVYKIGSVYLKAVQPRFPCFKLNIRFNREGMLQQFVQQAKHGTYFSVEQQGTLKAGDEITLVEQSKCAITIQQLVDCYNDKGADKNVLDQILEIEFLPVRLRNTFESYLK